MWYSDYWWNLLVQRLWFQIQLWTCAGLLVRGFCWEYAKIKNAKILQIRNDVYFTCYCAKASLVSANIYMGFLFCWQMSFLILRYFLYISAFSLVLGADFCSVSHAAFSFTKNTCFKYQHNHISLLLSIT